MSNLKKIIALTLVFVMTAAFAVTASAVDYTDQKDITNITQATMLRELSIMAGYPEGDFKPAGNLTRGEFAKMVYVALNNGNDDKATAYVGLSSNVPFTDTKGHWAEGYINFTYSAKIVSGKTPTTFDPNGTLTGYEGLKMLCVALGYDAEKEVFTGSSWQLNVLRLSQRSNLLEGFTGDAAIAISRDNAALIIYNTLFAYIVTYTDNAIDTSGSDTLTFAEKRLRMKAFTGVLVANEQAGLDTATSKADECKIAFDLDAGGYGLPKTIPTSAPLDLLGKNVSVYVRFKNTATISDDPATNDILRVFGSITETPKKNTTWTFNYGNVDAADVGNLAFNDGKLQYKDGDDKRHYVNSGSTPVIVNYGKFICISENFGKTLNSGAANENSTGTKLKESLRNGSIVTMIDNDDDGNADYVLITTKEYAKVTENSTASNRLSIDYGSKTKIDGDDYKDAIGPIKDFAVNDRILWYQIGDGKYVVELAPKFDGKMTGKTGTGKDMKVRIDGSTYQSSGLEGSKVSDSTIADGYGTGNKLGDSKNLNVTKAYYTDGTYITEVTGDAVGTGTAGKYLVIKGHEVSTSGSSGTVTYKMDVLLQDGTNVDGAVASKFKDIKMDIAAADVADTDFIALRNNWTPTGSGSSTVWPLAGKVYSYKVVDGKYELNVTDYRASTMDITTGKAYSNKDATISVKTSPYTMVVDDSTYCFSKNSSGDWKAYKGKALIPTLNRANANGVVIQMFTGDYNKDNDNMLIKAFSIEGTAAGTTDKKYGVAMTDPDLDTDEVTGEDYLTFKLFDGTSIIDVRTTTDPDIKVYTTGGTGTSITKNTGAFSEGTIMAYTFSSSNVIDSIEVVRMDGNNNSSTMTNNGTFKFGYAENYLSNLLTFSTYKIASVSNAFVLAVDSAVKIYMIDLDAGTATESSVRTINVNDIRTLAEQAGEMKIRTAVKINDDGDKVDTIYCFTDEVGVGGTRPTATNGTVSPTAQTIDKFTPVSADTTLTLTSGSYTFIRLTRTVSGTTSTVTTTLTGNTHVLDAAYLNALAVGTYTFTFVMNDGTNPTFVLTVTDTTPTP